MALSNSTFSSIDVSVGKNGKDILPETDLAEIQKHFAGELIYIPKTDEQRCSWGTSTTTKRELETKRLLCLRHGMYYGCHI